MESGELTSSVPTPDVGVRDYTPADYSACRMLWAELTEHHRRIRPVARNVSAIRRFYDAGFQTLGGHVDLTMDLADRNHRWLDGTRLHGLDFRY